MPARVVDADSNHERDRIGMDRGVDRTMAIAEVFKAMPWFVWATPGWILAGLVCLAIGQDGIGGFTSHVMGWLSLIPWIAGILCGVKAIMWAHNTYHRVRTDAYNRRLLSANVQKVEESIITVRYKNAALQADVEIRNQMPEILARLAAAHVPFEFDAKGNLKVLSGPGGVRVTEMGDQAQVGAGPAGLLGPGNGGPLPTKVLYEDIRGQVPRGHVLVGIGLAGVETKAATVGACVWIVGLSGTGKTSTTVIRVEERASDDHFFLGVDPHWFKDDSLYHSIYETTEGEPGAYKELFLMPMARNTEEAKAVLQAFLDEFYGRKAGRIPKPWRKVTLLVDELGALVDTTCEEEEEVKAMLKSISRICGQEARNFMMGGIFISQQATELAWLRKVALMVIVHQLNMESEKKLATNNDKAVMDDMKTWPIGRTYVFGVGFGQEGPRTVQQPYYAGRRHSAPAGGDDGIVEADQEANQEDDRLDGEHQADAMAPVVPALSGDLRAVYDACQQLLAHGQVISARSVAELIPDMKKDKANNLINRLQDLGYIQRRKAV